MVRRFAEFVDIVVASGGAAGDVSGGTAEVDLGSYQRRRIAVGARIWKLFLVDVVFVADGGSVDLCGAVVHEVLGGFGDFGDG